MLVLCISIEFDSRLNIISFSYYDDYSYKCFRRKKLEIYTGSIGKEFDNFWNMERERMENSKGNEFQRKWIHGRL